jgi:hypothetical protein
MVQLPRPRKESCGREGERRGAKGKKGQSLIKIHSKRLP